MLFFHPLNSYIRYIYVDDIFIETSISILTKRDSKDQ